jgi:hypothetical protein
VTGWPASRCVESVRLGEPCRSNTLAAPSMPTPTDDLAAQLLAAVLAYLPHPRRPCPAFGGWSVPTRSPWA